MNGSYAVQVSNNNCVDTSDCLTISNIGLNELETDLFHVSPNPSSGQFVISFKDVATGTLRLFDLNGRVILTQNLNAVSSAAIEVKGDSGYYILSFENESGDIARKKLIKK